MNCRGFELKVRNLPELDPDFIPFAAVKRFVDASGAASLAVSLETNAEKCWVHHFRILGGDENLTFDRFYVERLVKFLLWMKGANSIGIYGNSKIAAHIKKAYQAGGAREFDAAFMAKVFEGEFRVGDKTMDLLPAVHDAGISIGGNLDGCRIGFDAGGSDMKVCAVQNGEVLFSEEIVWYPKLQEDPSYHYEWILAAMKKAATFLPRVDAIGVSSAGIYVANRCMVASLFIKVPENRFHREVKDIYIRAAKEIGAPLVVLNDGDVAALAGAIGMETNSVLGIAMGTSEAAGFVDVEGNIKGWLNELAFAPVDLNERAMTDEWSGDFGCGVKYFSQDGVIKLAKAAGLDLNESDSPAQKLSAVQEAMAKDHPGAQAVFRSLGVYFGHTAALYHDFYGMKNILLMGRAVSGEGGDVILDEAKKVLREDYPELDVFITLPDEKTRRVGQAVIAASLPKLV